MAAEGWLVVSIEYTLADKTHPTWDVATDQVACALAWTAQNAAAYGGDSSRLAVLGDSAGGNLAVTTSYRAAAGALTSPCRELPAISAVAVVYPAVAPATFFANTTPP
jgi:acetyl esterase